MCHIHVGEAHPVSDEALNKHRPQVFSVLYSLLQGKMLGHLSEILSTKCSRKIMREEKNNQYFQITLKFVKWHYVRIAMIAVFQKELCPILTFLLWELCEVYFKSDLTQTFPDNYSS